MGDGLRRIRVFVTLAALAAGGQAHAGNASLNLYGMPGLIDMPTAESAPDAQMSSTLGYFSGTVRGTLTFQVTPRLTASMRYAMLMNCNCFSFVNYFDRSFDLHYRILDEGRYRPAIAVGLRDLIGTGVYSGEYLAATKHLGPKLKVTAGIGWGRLGSYNSFTNPLSIFGSGFNTRPSGFGLGGVPVSGQWFRGPAAAFGGVEWQTPVRGLSVKAEYSSDAYSFETGAPGLLTRRSPVNIGVDYQIGKYVRLSGYYLYGTTIGVSTSIKFNPRNRISAGSGGNAPTPILRRPRDFEKGAADARDTSWTSQPDANGIVLQSLKKIMKKNGLYVIAFSLDGTRAEVRFRNKRYDQAAQAVGRTARIMAKVMPFSVETFVVTPVEQGIPVVSVILQRRDLEDLENAPDGAENSLARAQIVTPQPMRSPVTRNVDLFPHLNWSIGPYMRLSLFDPSAPVLMDVGIRAEGQFDVSPGLSVSGSVIKKIVGNLDQSTRVSDSLLPHVRSDVSTYDKADPALEYLTGDYLFRAGRSVYGRVSVGYLEQMYGGVSAELLWKPLNSRFGLGMEANLVRQRAFDGGLGFRPYQVATGHVTAYLDMRNGFSAQLDVGRYLAGDVGATLSIERRFDNGWRVGAFATLTDVPFATFGEGSFDKGLLITMPISWALGKPTRTAQSITLRPLTRDGGAKLEVRNRLWKLVNPYQTAIMEPAWARFWR
ncbi:MAG: YjbH domain-containing protein [Paracoccaceae bacterium]